MIHYQRNTKCYSPKGIRNLFEQAIKDEKDGIEAVLKKRKHQNLRELWHASFLALAIKKWLKKEFYLSEPKSDPPDVLFRDLVNNEGFGVEVMDLFFYGQPIFDGNYKKLAQTIWDKKGLKDLKNCHLLVVSRIIETSFNVSKLIEEIRKFDWKYVERIWFGIYTSSNINWTFFEIYPPAQYNDKANISFSTINKEDMSYWY